MRTNGRAILTALVLAGAGVGAWWVLREPSKSGPQPAPAAARDAVPSPEGATLAGTGGAAFRAASAHAGRSAIEGLVTRDGKPAAARIEARFLGSTDLTAFERRLRAQPLAAEFAPPQPRAAPDASVAAGADGRFTIAGVGPGIFGLTAVATDGARARAHVLVAADGARVATLLDLLPADLAFTGRVEWSDGRPFPGTLYLDRERARTPGDVAGTFGNSASIAIPIGSDGSFRGAGLQAGRSYVKVVSADGVLVHGQPVMLPASEPYVLIVPVGKERVNGRVVDGMTGAPIAGATVRGWSNVGGPLSVLFLRTTDADGRFTVDVPRLPTEFQAEAPGYARGDRSAANSGEFVIGLLAVARVSGTVRAESGEAAAGAVVLALAAQRLNAEVRLRTVADREGRYAFAGVPLGEVSVVVNGGGWVSPGLADVETGGSNPLTVVVRAGGETTADRVAARGARIEGVVINASGAPVVGATVQQAKRGLGEMYPFRGLEGVVPEPVSTAADGTFGFDSLVPEMAYTFTASAPGYVPVTSAEVRASAGAPGRIELRFPAPRFVDVLVLFEDDGSPAVGASAELWSLSERGSQPHWTGSADARPVDAEGRVRIGPAGAGALAVRITGEVVAGSKAGSWISTGGKPPTGAIEVEGSKEGPGPFALTARVARGLTIEGRVLKADGTPAAGGNVSVQPTGGMSGTVMTSVRPDGTFVLPGVSAGAHRVDGNLQVEGSRYVRGSTDAAAGARDVTITLAAESAEPAPLVLLVRIVDESGKAVDSAQVRVLSKRGQSSSMAHNGLARVNTRMDEKRDDTSMEGVKVEVWNARGVDGMPLPLGPGRAGPLVDGQTEVEVRLPPELAVSGRIVDQDGHGLAGVLVRARPGREGEEAGRGEVAGTARGDAEGRFRVGGLGPGPHSLEVAAPPDFVSAEPVRVTAGDTKVELRLTRGVAVRLRVLDYAGNPVAKALVNIRPPGATTLEVMRAKIERMRRGARDAPETRAWTDVEGRVAFRGVDPAPTVGLEVTPPEGRTDLRRFVLEPWTPADLEVRLERGYGVAGVLQDALGKPVAKGFVSRKQPGGVEMTVAHTGEDGTFRIVDLVAGEVILTGHGPGMTGSTSAPLTVQAGAENVVLVVDAGVELILRIVSPPERRAAETKEHAWLRAQREGQWQVVGSAWAEKDAGGPRMVFPGLRPDERYAVWISAQNEEWYGHATDLRAGQGEVTVRMERGGTIRGRVTAPAGVGGLNVQLNSEPGPSVNAQVDAEGRYELKGVPPGRWTIRGYGRAADKRFEGSGTAGPGDTLDLTLAENIR